MKSYKIQDDVFLQKVVNETVILAPDNGNYFSLDEVGSRMIELFRETGSVEKTVAAMAQEYNAAEVDIERDLVTLLDEMVQHGVVEAIES